MNILWTKICSHKRIVLFSAFLLACLALIVFVFMHLFIDKCNITVTSSNPQYGTVTGSGRCFDGSRRTIRAIAAEDCIFVHWSDGSIEPVRKVNVDNDATYIAVFYGPAQTLLSTTPPENVYIENTDTMYQSLIDRVVTFDETIPEGYILSASQWVTEENDSIEYVSDWPSGFSQDHYLYSEYQSAPASMTTDSGENIQISKEHIGYIYWHWCKGDISYGPINRTTSPYQNAPHDTFHAYFSEVEPDISGEYIFDGKKIPNPTPDGTYHHPSSCCKDTYWYYVTEVFRQDYKKLQYTYEHWSEAQEVPPEGDEVRSITLYRYRPQ